MTADKFDEILARRLKLTAEVLKSKAGEYATNKDRLHNFKEAALLEGDTPANALRGMLRKHWVSVMDLCDVEKHPGDFRVTAARIDEKIGDAINYLILLEACLMELDPATRTKETLGEVRAKKVEEFTDGQA